jgi:HAD superfamily hydrolase (TIGR01484 family)
VKLQKKYKQRRNNMTKQMIAFDLDDTLSITKSAIDPRMSQLLMGLLECYDVCVISGANIEQLHKQVTSHLPAKPRHLQRLHLMPTCGTRYYRFDESTSDWVMQYSNEPTAEQKRQAREVLTKVAKELGLWPENPYGEVIEDRGSQLTLTALGQDTPAELKYAWDPTGEKKLAIRDAAAPLLPELEVRAAGTTSVDVTLKGIDKAYGMRRLMEYANVTMEQILFIGDKLDEGGNDYQVKAMGIDVVAVEKWEDTALVVETLVKIA